MAEADLGMHGGLAPERQSLGAGAIINVFGGIVSLALIAGVLVWGYQILARDVSGVPVVMALDGPMRKAPVDPGGQPADYQGMAVNEVAAEGIAAAPRDRLTLAPPAMALSEEDAPQSILAAVTLPEVEPNPDVEAAPSDITVTPLDPAEQSDVDAIIASLVDPSGDGTLGPVEPLADGSDEPEVVASLAPVEAEQALGGVGRSLRPQVRPASLSSAATPVTAEEVVASIDIDPDTIAPGTRLVQLGAFDSEEVARSEWARLDQRFGDFMEGKQRVVQQATKAGRTFYRLRAHGFDDVADARRFCSALVAQNAACIPVLVQ